MDYPYIFVNATVRAKYSAAQLEKIDEAVALIRERMNDAEKKIAAKRLSGDKKTTAIVRAYNKAVKEALEIVPLFVLQDILDNDGIASNNAGLTPKEFFRYQYLWARREYRKREIATFAIKGTLKFGAILAGAFEDDEEQQERWEDAADAIEFDENDNFPELADIYCKNQWLFEPTDNKTADEAISAINDAELDNWMEDLLKS